MALAIGDRLGPYEIVSPLGHGGMGEVYRARDTRLGREVAIKILPAHLASDPSAVARFEQEARAVAALSHPNILAIHDVGREGGVVYAVSELLNGETLRDRLEAEASAVRRAPSFSDSYGSGLPLRKAVDVASQVAQGLAAAHAKGIVHRDIKPENIFITADGHVKILDFGLAKVDVPAPSDLTAEARLRTDPGTVLGTTGYLSPEQAQARPVDFRSDIFSFGAALYEMVTGVRAFKADSTIDTLHQIIHRDPRPVDQMTRDVPGELKWLLTKCLAKDPDDRYQSTRDLVVDLRNLARTVESSPRLAVTAAATGAGRRVGPLWLAALAGVVALAVIGVFLLSRSRQTTTAGAPFASAKAAIERITALGTVIDAAISPDGKYVAYVTAENALQGLWLRQLATASTLQLVPPSPVGFFGITFSPDGSAIYYALYSAEQPDRGLFRVPALGGAPRKLLTGIYSAPAFSPDGRRMAYLRGEYPDPETSSLMVADIDGQNVRALATRRPPEFFVPIFFTAAAWSPDGTFIVCPTERRQDRVVGTLVAVDANTGKEHPFPHYEWPGVGQAKWMPDGRSLVVVGTEPTNARRQLWWIDATRPDRRQITSDLLDYRLVSIASDGSTLVTVAADATATIWSAPLDGAGEARRLSNGRYDGVSGIAAAPGDRLLYRSLESGTASIWIMDEDGSHRAQLTTEGVTAWPTVAADGQSAIFAREGSGLWRIGLDGQRPQRIEGTTSALYPVETPDGKWIVFSSTATGVSKLWKVPASGGPAVPVLDGFATRPAISPDGKQLAFFYQERPDSAFVLAVMPFDGTRPTATFRVAPSTAFSTVRWTADGKSLLHNTAVGDRANIWLQPLAGGPVRQVTHFVDQNILSFDRSVDGKRLIIARGVLSRDAVLIRNFR